MGGWLNLNEKRMQHPFFQSILPPVPLGGPVMLICQARCVGNRGLRRLAELRPMDGAPHATAPDFNELDSVFS